MNYYKEIADKIFNLERLDWNLLKQVPEFAVVYGNPENQIWHQEGTTDKHIDLMVELFFDKPIYELVSIYPRNYLIAFYMAIYFHDFQKPATLSRDSEGIIHNYGHERLGARYLWDFMYKAYDTLTPDQFETILFCSQLIFWHMDKKKDFWDSKRAKYALTTFKKSNINLLGYFHKIDMEGAIGGGNYDTSLVNYMYNLRQETPDYFYQSNKGVLNICIGPSGSGKSTFAKSLEGAPGVTIVSTDAIRAELGDEEDQSRNDEVFGIARQRVRKGLEVGHLVVVDAVNRNFKNRKIFVEIAHKMRCCVTAHVFLTPLSICLENQQKRSRKVPEFVIKKHYEGLELPCGTEFNNIKYHEWKKI